MKLKVPHYQQQRGLSCGLAAMRMLFGYFGDEVTEKELDKQTKRHSGPRKLPFGTKILEEME